MLIAIIIVSSYFMRRIIDKNMLQDNDKFDKRANDVIFAQKPITI